LEKFREMGSKMEKGIWKTELIALKMIPLYEGIKYFRDNQTLKETTKLKN
jgi:hypothetical protein